MADLSAYEADGLQFLVNVVADPNGSTPVPNLSGGTGVAYARSGETTVTGTATCTGVAQVSAVFAPFALAFGEWEVEVAASATVAPYKTVYRGTAQMLDSIRTS